VIGAPINSTGEWPAVAFRSLTEADLPAVARWLREVHVQEWWKDPSAPERVREKYLPRILGNDPTDMYVVMFDGHDIGLIQSYRVGDHPRWADTIAGSGLVFPSAAGIDYFIGERDYVGHGIGSAAIRAFTDLVFAAYPDVDEIVVTPQADNRASCRVLVKAGYELVWTGMLDSDDPSDSGLAALYRRTR
jgi:RimJ/RimL family protein N-acetyltransferase